MTSPTTTIRVRRETRERLKRLAHSRGLSTPELVAELIARAEDDDLFARHSAAYDDLRRHDPGLLARIEQEDAVWERSDLERPIPEG